MGIGKGTGRGGARPGSGPKPRAEKSVNLTLYLTEQENDAIHFLASDRGKPVSRCVAEIIMREYHRVVKGE